MGKIVADPSPQSFVGADDRYILAANAVTDARPLVLVVDDYPDAREMYAEWLRVCGYRVEVAGTVDRALELVQHQTPAAILMDLSLPGVDGFEATRQLKADERTCHIPVLALSGHVGADTATRAMAAGCDRFLVKPLPLQVVVAEVERLVGRVAAPETAEPAKQ
jgi:two-component system, cell cycle response regulator DivK